jgi:hypothetical protein
MNPYRERYFFLSGLISISFFAALVIIIGYSLYLSPKSDVFAMTQSDVIYISIDLSELKEQESSQSDIVAPLIEPESQIAQMIETKSPLPEPKSIVSEVKPTPKISELFGDVKAQKNEKQHQENVKRREELNELENEILMKKETPRFSDRVKSVKVLKGGSTGPTVDKYYAMIFAFVEKNFNPPIGTVGSKASVMVVLGPSGELKSFQILAYSNNKMFNNEVDRLVDKLAQLSLPPHPEGEESRLKFELMKTAKE